MISIKFSHKYDKMPRDVGTAPTILLAVIPFEDVSCSQAFFDYDTRYIGKDGKLSHYELPQGKKLLLMLSTMTKPYGAVVNGSVRHNWQTIRRYTEDKYTYYKEHLGEEVKIEVD